MPDWDLLLVCVGSRTSNLFLSYGCVVQAKVSSFGGFPSNCRYVPFGRSIVS